MPPRRKILWLGVALYVISFSLRAVAWPQAPPQPSRGWECAYISLAFPWVEGWQYLHGVPALFSPLQYAALAISGWVNPIFLLLVWLKSRDNKERLQRVLMTILLVAIPFSWIFLRLRHFKPLEGHFLWVVGIVLVVGSDKLNSLSRFQLVQSAPRDLAD